MEITVWLGLTGPMVDMDRQEVPVSLVLGLVMEAKMEATGSTVGVVGMERMEWMPTEGVTWFSHCQAQPMSSMLKGLRHSSVTLVVLRQRKSSW